MKVQVTGRKAGAACSIEGFSTPTGGIAEGTKRNQSGEEIANVPRCLVWQGGDLSFFWISEFADENRGVGIGETETESDNTAGYKEHGDWIGS